MGIDIDSFARKPQESIEDPSDMTLDDLQSECKVAIQRSLEALNSLWESSQKLRHLANIAGYLAHTGQVDHNIVLTEILNWKTESTELYPKDVMEKLEGIISGWVDILFEERKV